MNDQKKNFLSRFLDHPYISAIILVAVFFALRELMIAALGRGLSVVLDHTNLPEYAAIEMLYWSMTIMASVSLCFVNQSGIWSNPILILKKNDV